MVCNDARERRKYRRSVLDNKRLRRMHKRSLQPQIENTQHLSYYKENVFASNHARERRKYRRFVLDNKRSRKINMMAVQARNEHTQQLLCHNNNDKRKSRRLSVGNTKSNNMPSSLNAQPSHITHVINTTQNDFQVPHQHTSSLLNSNSHVHRNEENVHNNSLFKSPIVIVPTNINFFSPSSTISNDLESNFNETNATERRKYRKTIIANKRAKQVGTSKLVTSVSTTFVINTRHNGLSTPSTVVHSPSSTSNRIPLSDISNAFPNDKTPVSNKLQMSSVCNGTASTNRSTIIHASSSTVLPTGKHTLKRKSRMVSSIPIFDLTEGIQHNTDDSSLNGYRGISKGYVDHGDQIVTCATCQAKLWEGESRRGNKLEKTNFFLCCGYGKVELAKVREPHQSYQNLFRSLDSKSKHFIKNIRRYNSMFSFTSMGGKVDSSINKGNAPYTFRLSGQNVHSIGSLLPVDGSTPKFSQLYIYDTENEDTNRLTSFGSKTQTSNSNATSYDLQIIQYLRGMLDANNVLVKSFRMVRDCFHANPNADLKLRIIYDRQTDGRTYNLPTVSEVAALIVGDIADAVQKRDIVVQRNSGYLQKISELHPSYISLQYPLLFPYGEDGYRIDILHRGVIDPTNCKRANCTMREFFAYKMQDRDNCFSLILNARRLFQQFLVDGYTMIESERLKYIRLKQKELRCETFENLRKVQQEGNSHFAEIGQRVILPSSFTGGARYMMQNYLDAMSLCKWFGYPDLFITFTCNPKWPEIKRFLKDTTLNPEDRPDILCRLFKIKLDALIKDFRHKRIFGDPQAVVYTIEFQKRGLPHSHICLFLQPQYKFPTVELIDPIISAEIPNIDSDPELYSLVKEFMMHGPCGPENVKCPCMVDNKCSKNFPKKFRDHSSIDGNGFPVYRRRNNGCFVEKSGVRLDNRHVVPYNKYLLKRYQAHINVEWCNQGSSIKYLFKYINKGPDRASIKFVPNNQEDGNVAKVDEIKDYYDCRYLSACEASWRIYGFDVHYRKPSVLRLPFHLPGEHRVVFGAEDDPDDVTNKTSVASSMFLSWMECNQKYEQARALTYVEFPTQFVFNTKDKVWAPRQRGFSIGRIHSVSPKLGEAYFLRILLNFVKGPTSFQDIRTVNGEVFPTFRDACFALGLLDDDKEYIEAIKEASLTGSGYYLRSLFATMLHSGSLSRPDYVWNNTWKELSDGILYNQQRILKSPGLTLSDYQIQNLTLFEIEQILLRNNSSLKEFIMMPFPDTEVVSSSNNRLITEELSYNIEDEQVEYEKLLLSLTNEQLDIFHDILSTVSRNKGGVFFVYGYGGTGKTFLWKTLSAAIRSKGEIVLNVASSGIASLLLTGGRTAHSRFHLPLDLHEDSQCFIKPNSDAADLLRKAKLIIWDEAPMVHKHAFEALDRTLKDILGCDDASNNLLPFGGKVIVFGGDFRQILPVVTNGSRQDIVNSALCSSYLWPVCKLKKLTRNMRLSIGSNHSDIEEIRNFANWLLEIGEGKVGGPNDGEVDVDIPQDLLINDFEDPIWSLIEFVYPSILENCNTPGYFQERAILAPKHEVVDEVNERLLALFPGNEKEYLSSDSISPEEFINDEVDVNLYSPDYLNGIKASGLPVHKLVLKKGVPVMLLRNIDQKNGLCNGTRLRVVHLGKRVIEAEILSGTNIGDRTFIPRMSLTPSDKRIAFKFRRRQFPLAVCFGMTINKSQGQSLSKVGLLLRQPVFTHGQLYVALSRVKSKQGLRVLILDKHGKPTSTTTNVVFKEVFRNLR